MTEDARRYLAQPEFARLWQAARERYERNGRAAGRLTVEDLTAAEAHALAGLLGPRLRRAPRAGGSLAVSLDVLDQVLLASRFELTLAEALEDLGGKLTLRPQQRAAAAQAADEFWASWLAHPACADRRVSGWVQGLRSSGQARLAKADGGAALDRALSAAVLLSEQAPVELPTLAAAVGDPHCLDYDQPAGKLLVGLLAHRERAGLPRSAGERRALLSRCGVQHDALSSDVLCLGLPALGDGQLAQMLAVMQGSHLRLTYAHLSRERLRFPAGLIVHTCENPVVLARAETLASTPPLICTEGQPSTAAGLLLRMLTDAGAEIHHHGDFDVGGLNIAALLAREHGAQAWRYDVDAYLYGVQRVAPRAPTLAAMRLANFRSAPFTELAQAMSERRVAVYEEDVIEALVDDLAAAGRSASRCTGSGLPRAPEAGGRLPAASRGA